MSIPSLLDKKPTVAPVGSAGERSGGARKVPYGAARSNSERATLSACVAHRGDVGGGHGHTLCSILGKYPHLKGTVLELPSVLENTVPLWADKMGAGGR